MRVGLKGVENRLDGLSTKTFRMWNFRQQHVTIQLPGKT